MHRYDRQFYTLKTKRERARPVLLFTHPLPMAMAGEQQESQISVGNKRSRDGDGDDVKGKEEMINVEVSVGNKRSRDGDGDDVKGKEEMINDEVSVGNKRSRDGDGDGDDVKGKEEIINDEVSVDNKRSRDGDDVKGKQEMINDEALVSGENRMLTQYLEFLQRQQRLDPYNLWVENMEAVYARHEEEASSRARALLRAAGLDPNCMMILKLHILCLQLKTHLMLLLTMMPLLILICPLSSRNRHEKPLIWLPFAMLLNWLLVQVVHNILMPKGIALRVKGR